MCPVVYIHITVAALKFCESKEEAFPPAHSSLSSHLSPVSLTLGRR